MSSTRRDFLQRSATAASAFTLLPIGLESVTDAAPPVVAPDARFPAVKAVEDQLVKARPVSIAKVRLTGGPLKQTQDVTGTYLLSLDPNRMMAFYRQRAGLTQKAEPYGGWDGSGRQLTGHIAGHHLSGVSLMYLATGDVRFKDRATYLVTEMKEVQDKHGDGYLGALEGTLDRQPISGRDAFAMLSKGDIRPQAFDLNGMWSPWYVLHKTFAGLRDAYRHTGNKMALDLEVKFAAWAETLLKPLTEAQFQRMLLTEHGGMNEVLADLYADTGDKRWLNLSLRFEHHAFTDALKRHQDNLNGKHGNCQIPKLIGSAARYGYTGDPQDIMAASFFWDRVVQHHTYATGGHGLEEYFGPPDQLSKRVDGRVAETCNVYNMLKLTRRLFSLRPDAFYADFHERALFNHILGSIDPEDGRTSYMVPVGRGVSQEYQNMQQSFTCCVGSGMESHALHGDGLYYESAGTVWVNLFAPSTAELSSGVNLKMETGFPDGDTATLTMASVRTPREFTLAIRRPSWAGDAFSIKVNGTSIPQPTLASMRAGGAGGRNVLGEPVLQPSSFVEVTRTWKAGDVVELALPKSLRLEPTPDDARVAAIMWGPLVLGGDLGPRREGRGGGAGTQASQVSTPATGVAPGSSPAPTGPMPPPVLVPGDKALTEWIAPAATRSGDFRVQQIARTAAQPTTPTDVPLIPFYRLHRRTYSLYFDVLTDSEWNGRVAAAAAERERARKLDAATVAYVQPGSPQTESPFNYQSDPADRQPARVGNRTNRSGTGWFSYDMTVDATTAMAVVVTYQGATGAAGSTGSTGSTGSAPAPFEILVDGTSIGRFERNATAEGFYDVTYAVPANLVRGKTKVTVKFQASQGGRIVPVFGVRMIKSDLIR